MSTALIIYGAVLVILTMCATASRKYPAAPAAGAAAHSLTQPTINYAGNPNRIGAYVYVMESNAPDPSLDWSGTFIGMSDGMALVRDQHTHVVAHVNRDQVYSAQR